MCGLFGASSTFLSDQEKQYVLSLSTLSTLRGTDSSGFAVSSEDDKAGRFYRTRKGLQVAPELLLTNRPASSGSLSPHETFLGSKDKVSTIIGHCRAATKGLINKTNAHPFHVGNIIGVHNGTIPHLVPNSLTEKEQSETPLGSDSFQLFDFLSKNSLEDTHKEANKGAFAIVWFDTSNNTLNVMRNEDRTLYYTKRGSTIYWASEKDFLKLGLSRGGAYVPDSEIKSFETHKHYSKNAFSDKDFEVKDNFGSKSVTTFQMGYSFKQTKEEAVETNVVSPLDVKYHKIGKRIIPLSLVSRSLCADGTCSYCTNHLNTSATISFVDYSKGSNTITNEEFATKYIVALCNTCVKDKEALLIYAPTEIDQSIVASIPLDITLTQVALK